ncbi:helix-turn-helix domain-containing protein [Cohnella sp. GCM10020058]|uniref:helix-turn-helix domain-containing protein n=1 Tax=Cohnella sp. GCM10020058 TaxID=3317330 RepID=UPI003643E418
MSNPFSRTTVHPNPRASGTLSVLFAGYSQTEPEHRMGPQKLDHYLIHTVAEGKGWFKCRDRHYDLEEGDTFVILPGEMYAYESDKERPWRYRWIAFHGPDAERWLAAAGVDALHPIVRGGSEEALRAMRAVDGAFAKKSWTADWEAEGWLRLAFAAWAKANRPTGPAAGAEPRSLAAVEADRAARWLQAQQSDPSVTIARMAAELGYHRTHLTKLFKRETGMTPVAYLQQLRIERASSLLAEPLSVEEVALSVGYSDPLYFSKSFKKMTGHTPSEYRKMVRAGIG